MLAVGFGAQVAPGFAAQLKTLQRDLEPVVRSAEELQLKRFLNERLAISKIAAYRYQASDASWTKVPFQIDQRTFRDFGNSLICDPATGEPACACEIPPSCSNVVCEESYVWDGEDDPDDPPSDPNSLDLNDQIVFMAKDTGDQAPVASVVIGSTGQRYELAVRDASNGEIGYVYLYKFSTGQSPVPGYMTYTRDTSGTPVITTFETNCHSDLIGYDGYQIRLATNWSIRDVKVRSVVDGGGGTPQCVDFSTRTDVLDRVKWRMFMQTEETWNNFSAFLGDRVGPVRAIRCSLGARSGFGTTNCYLAYPTYFRQDVHLRVHVLTSPIETYDDFMQAAAGVIGTGNPCLGSEFEIHRENTADTRLDDVDGIAGTCAGSTMQGAEDPRQMNSPHASIAEVMIEDPEHRMPDTTGRDLTYTEDGSAALEVGLEDEAGAYGNIGSQWGNPNSTEELVCPSYPYPEQRPAENEHYAGITRVWQIKTGGSGLTRADQLETFEKDNPLQVTASFLPASGGPSDPCIGSFGVSDPGNGLNAEGTVTPCAGDNDLWYRLYRAGATGPFQPHMDLRHRLSFKDNAVERNTTYRYYVVAYNSAGQYSAPSAVETVTVTDVTAPNPPVISGTVSGNVAVLNWEFTTEFDLAGYNIYRSTIPGGPYDKLTLGGPVRTNNATAQLAEIGVTYYFVLKTVDQGGLESAASNEIALVAQ